MGLLVVPGSSASKKKRKTHSTWKKVLGVHMQSNKCCKEYRFTSALPRFKPPPPASALALCVRRKIHCL